jgi:glycosyltransferase involved in cell wall biosynthesis
VLVYTTLFPGSVQPVLGQFTLERMRHLLPFVDITVIAPVPYFPRIKLNQRWFKFAVTPHTERFAGFEIDHPRFVVIPKVGMTTHGFSMFAGTLPQVWRRLRAANYDLIDAQFIYPEGLAAVMLGAFFKKPVVVSALGSDINVYPQLRMIRPLVKEALKRADAVISVAQSLKDAMVELGCPAEKVRVIPNGIDPARFSRKPRLAARLKLGLAAGRPTILSIGNLTRNKGFHVLVDAVEPLRVKHPNIMLVVIGDGECRSELIEQIRSLGLEDNVQLIGARPHSELPDWYSAADLFCLASEYEGCPNVVLEALACGCPVVATRAGGIGDMVVSRALGRLVERTPEAFESALHEALGCDWDHKAIAEYGQSHALDKIATRLLDVYQDVIARHKNR